MRSVIIIGAGPAGLSAARFLVQSGLKDVLVLERNQEPGGLPRCCGHWGWGMLDQHRILTGPSYGKRLAAAAQGAEIRTDVTVTALKAEGRIEVSSPNGMEVLEARAILLATGIREAPRSARLVSGTRPWGVITTGAFQDMAYRGSYLPFQRPVIIGSELVSFSALLTARHAGIKPVAMLEKGAEVTARWPSAPLAKAFFRVPIRLNAPVIEIKGREQVSSVVVKDGESTAEIPCDCVIFSGEFIPEASLVKRSHLLLDPRTNGPSIDTNWRCSDPCYFAAGNILRPVEHSGMAAWEGREAARAIAAQLKSGAFMQSESIEVKPAGFLKYVYPQRIAAPRDDVRLYARVSARCDGWLSIEADGREILRRRLRSAPERRITIRLPEAALAAAKMLTITAALREPS